jgi:hypothetical protein
LPGAICVQALALSRLGRSREAAALADTFSRRWPEDARGPVLHRAIANPGTDQGLVRPFDPGLPK